MTAHTGVLGRSHKSLIAEDTDGYAYCDSDKHCLETPASPLGYTKCAASRCEVEIADSGPNISYCSRRCRTTITSSDDALVVVANALLPGKLSGVGKCSRHDVFGTSSECPDSIYDGERSGVSKRSRYGV